MVGHLFYYG
uniref:Uncharacterized protein n=1 Tax=Anguilla anguilla TaxID=7936 RepID=A0A0E9UCC1_ANGAN